MVSLPTICTGYRPDVTITTCISEHRRHAAPAIRSRPARASLADGHGAGGQGFVVVVSGRVGVELLAATGTRCVVEAHHGRIRAHSRGLRHGARFTVELPVTN